MTSPCRSIDSPLASAVMILQLRHSSVIVGIALSTIPMLNASVVVTWTEDASGVTASYNGTVDLSVLGTNIDQETYPQGSVRNNRSFANYDGNELNRTVMALYNEVDPSYGPPTRSTCTSSLPDVDR